MDQDWTLTMQPQCIPLKEWFPQCFTVNSLQHHSHLNYRFPEEQQMVRRCTKGKQKENLNMIPVPQDREEGEIPYNMELGQCYDNPDFND
jgi:hypothetical protein